MAYVVMALLSALQVLLAFDPVTRSRKHGEQMADCFLQLAKVHMYFGNLELASASAQYARDVRSAVFGAQSSAVGGALSVLAAIEGALGGGERGVVLARQALEIKVATVGRDHLDTAKIHERLAKLLADLGRHQESAESIWLCFDSRVRLRGMKHKSTIDTRDSINATQLAWLVGAAITI